MATATQNPQARGTGLITPDELYRRLGVVGRQAIYNAIRAGRIRHLKIGRRILVLETEIEEWPLREAGYHFDPAPKER